MQPSIGILLRELARLYTQAQREHVTSGHDTSSTQSHVLMELGRTGLLTQHELGRRLSLDKGWVSRAVESLVQSGLVAKSRHENDRRSRWLQLTSKGTARYQALNETLDAHAEQLMQPLAAEQRASIYQALVLLLNGLQSSLPQEALPSDEIRVALSADIAQADNTDHATVSHETVAAEAEQEAVTSLAETSAAAIADKAIIDAQAEVKTSVLPPVDEKAASLLVTPLTVVNDEATTVEKAREKPEPSARSNSPARPGQPGAPTRILGSKTLPTRPLLSRTMPRTPLTRAAQSAEQNHAQKHEDTLPTTQFSARGLTSPLHTARTSSSTAHEPAHAPARQTAPLTHSAPRTFVVPPVKAASPAQHQPAQPITESRPNGSLFHKLLSQGSLFNKLLQRDQAHQDEQKDDAPAPEVEPADGIQFQAAFQTDWNEIRNLLTANRQPVQGALNHLSNFMVATENGRIVGALGLEIYGDIGLLRSLVVASNMRGRSIAKRLIKRMIERCKSKQLSALYLLTGNADALFVRYGFEKMPRADMPTKLYVSMELQGPSSAASTGMRLIL